MTRAYADLSGQVFAQLTVLCRIDNDRHDHRRYRCVCACGLEIEVRGANLASGVQVSCGCVRGAGVRERTSRRNQATHARRTQARRAGDAVFASAHGRCGRCSRRRVLRCVYAELATEPAQRDVAFWYCRGCAAAFERDVAGLRAIIARLRWDRVEGAP